MQISMNISGICRCHANAIHSLTILSTDYFCSESLRLWLTTCMYGWTGTSLHFCALLQPHSVSDTDSDSVRSSLSVLCLRDHDPRSTSNSGWLRFQLSSASQSPANLWTCGCELVAVTNSNAKALDLETRPRTETRDPETRAQRLNYACIHNIINVGVFCSIRICACHYATLRACMSMLSIMHLFLNFCFFSFLFTTRSFFSDESLTDFFTGIVRILFLYFYFIVLGKLMKYYFCDYSLNKYVLGIASE